MRLRHPMRLSYLLTVLPFAIPHVRERMQHPSIAVNVEQTMLPQGSCIGFTCSYCPIGRQVCASIYAAERHIIMKAVLRKGD